MDRPIAMTGPNGAGGTMDHANGVTYNAAGQVSAMNWLQERNPDTGDLRYFSESRTYNSLYQLINQRTTANYGVEVAAEIDFGYTLSQNKRRIVSRTNKTNAGSIEQVVY